MFGLCSPVSKCLHRVQVNQNCLNVEDTIISVFTFKTGELPLARVAELRAGELTAELPTVLELALLELARLSELDVSLVVELSVELLLCRLTWCETVKVVVTMIVLQTELMLPLRLWLEMRSRC